MGETRVPPKGILFAGILYNERVEQDHLRNVLEEEFGPVLIESERFAFRESDYYAEEMGSPLWRIFLAFDRLIPMDSVVDIKLSTNRMETEVFSTGGRRTVNIDPGYLVSAKVVLATTKDYSHRLYLRDGIFAEVTLHYSAREKGFVPWQWTFRDYRREEALRFFNKLRAVYRDRGTI